MKAKLQEIMELTKKINEARRLKGIVSGAGTGGMLACTLLYHSTTDSDLALFVCLLPCCLVVAQVLAPLLPVFMCDSIVFSCIVLCCFVVCLCLFYRPVTAVLGVVHPRETAPNTAAHGTAWFPTSPRVVANITMQSQEPAEPTLAASTTQGNGQSSAHQAQRRHSR